MQRKRGFVLPLMTFRNTTYVHLVRPAQETEDAYKIAVPTRAH